MFLFKPIITRTDAQLLQERLQGLRPLRSVQRFRRFRHLLRYQTRQTGCGTVIPHRDFHIGYMRIPLYKGDAVQIPSRNPRPRAPRRAHMRIHAESYLQTIHHQV